MKKFPRCRKCKRAPQVIGKLCSFCWGNAVDRVIEKGKPSKIVVR